MRRSQRLKSSRVGAGAIGTVGGLLAACTMVAAGLVATAPPAAAAALPCDRNNAGPPGGRVAASDYLPGYGRTAADQDTAISVDEVLARAVDWKEAGPYYCQSDTYPDRHGSTYRPDCSGFVSMAWHLGTPYATGGLMGQADTTRIPMREVQPGDALINDHHTELVWKVEGDTITTIGFGWTPVDHQQLTIIGADATYGAYRYNKIELITDEMIRQAIEENVPQDPPVIQPPNGTSILNWPTLFSSDVEDPWQERVTLGIGTEVELSAEPVHFTWQFGDDHTKDSSHPGVGYDQPGYQNPDNRIVHEYEEVREYQAGVDITWTGYRYRVIGDDGTPEEWQPVDGEHVSSSETTPLDIIAMRSVLTGAR